MKIKFKKLDETAKIPTRGTDCSAGYDLTAVTKNKIYDEQTGHLKYIEYDLKLALEIPSNYAGFIFPRSSITKYGLSFSTGVSIIDSDYRGSIKLRFRPIEGSNKLEYKVGDKIAQMIIWEYPQLELIEVDELSETDRGEGGFGSTDGKEKSQAW